MYLCNDMTFTNDFVIYDQKVQWDFWSALLPFKGKCHFNTEKIQFKVQTTCVVCGWVCERASASNFNGKNTFFCSHYIYYKIMVKFTSNVNFSFKAFLNECLAWIWKIKYILKTNVLYLKSPHLTWIGPMRW